MLTDFAPASPPLHAAPAATAPVRRPGWGVALGALAVLLASVAAGLVLSRYQNPDAHYDEFFHVLAAEQWLETGKPKLVPGGDNYRRGELYTRMAAGAYQWFGVSIQSARLPALAAGALTVAAVGLLGFRAAGWLAGAAAGGLLLLTPGFINAAATARFYSAHVLSVVALALLVHEACRPGRRAWARAVWFAAAGLCAYVALHLHATTLVAGMGLGLWIGICAVVAATHGGHPRQRRLAWGFVLSGAVLVPIAVAITMQTAWGEHAWATFRWSPGWSQGDSGDVRYYHKFLLSIYGAMWALFPLAAVAALATRWRPATLFLCVFGVGFWIQSLGGAKAERYILYTYPFFALTWGLALDAAVRPLHAQVTHALRRAVPRPGFDLPSRVLSGAVIAACLAVFLYFQPFTAIARRMLTEPERGHPYVQARWASAAPLLRDLADDADAVVASADLKALFYLDRLDVLLNRLGELDAGIEEFGVSPNTLRPVISRPDALARVMDESPRGLIVIEPAYWRQAWGVPPETADLIETRAERVDAAAQTDLLIFRWPGSQ